jgi:hypothetical protein
VVESVIEQRLSHRGSPENPYILMIFLVTFGKVNIKNIYKKPGGTGNVKKERGIEVRKMEQRGAIQCIALWCNF